MSSEMPERLQRKRRRRRRKRKTRKPLFLQPAESP